jgi:hypothetical protein
MATKKTTGEKAVDTPAPKKRTLQDLRTAEMDPQIQYKIKQQTTVPGILLGSDLMVIRKFARINLPLARQRDSKIM